MNQNTHLLKSICEIPIRFSEVDSMEIVWHGHYIQYFEVGREAFGKEHGLGYAQVHEKGFTLPVVNISCDYKKSMKFGEKAIVETIYQNNNAAKIEFEYKIYRSSDSALAATGRSTQVFLDNQGILQLIVPEFISDWKKKNNLL